MHSHHARPSSGLEPISPSPLLPLLSSRIALTAILLLATALLPIAALADDTPEDPSTAGSHTVRVPLAVGKAEAPVPNSLLSVTDEATLEIIEAKWEHLRTTLNRSHRHEPLFAEGVEPDQIRPWAPATSSEPAFFVGGDPLVLDVNGTPSAAAPGGFSATVNEPSVAATGSYVFYTANWFAAASTDGGTTWAHVNPFAGPFAEPAGEDFCCDQQVHYDPSGDAVLWLQQLIPQGSTNNGTQRINVDQGSDGTWDCFYDVTPQDAGFPNATFPDYPDFSVSDQPVFVTSNVFGSGPGGFFGAFVARLPLTDVSTCANTNVDYFTSNSFGSFRTTQGATDTMYFADHASTVTLRVWSWPQGSASPTSVDRTINAFLNGTRTCPGPDNRDWCGFIDSRIFAAAVAGNRVAFFWTAQQNPGGGFPFPYSQGTVLDASNNLAVIDQPLIWSNDAAWAYPSLAANGSGGFGGTVLWGGGSHFPQCSAFLADAQNGHTFDPLEHAVAISGTTGPSLNRSGDYLATRAYHPNDEVYAASCFAFFATNAGTSRYLLFGRNSAFQSEIFTDGFESGNTTAWSSP
ncbi:MAG: hypothetical protein MI919_24310 [Holophagales bacterium]|nr:hypothetical protein [Holophagales bacterium]